jgi:hypothetical protein
MDLPTLLEKTTDSDFLREMIGFTAQRLMDLEVESLTGAPHGSRSADRLTHRNGYRDRIWETRAGTVELRIPSCAKAVTSRAAAAEEREGADGGDPGSLRPWCFHPLGR